MINGSAIITLTDIGKSTGKGNITHHVIPNTILPPNGNATQASNRMANNNESQSRGFLSADHCASFWRMNRQRPLMPATEPWSYAICVILPTTGQS